MTNPDDVEAILTGTFTLLGLFGVPAAVVAAPIISIVRGIFGIRNTRKGNRY